VLYLKTFYNLIIIMSLYTTLGVNHTASKKDIKDAYKNLILIHHPDKPTGSSVKFKEIHKAYSILYDDAARNVYNSNLCNVKNPYDNIIDWIINNSLFKHIAENIKNDKVEIKRNEKLNIIENLKCTLEDRYLNKIKKIEIIRDTLPSKLFDITLSDNTVILYNEGETDGHIFGDLFININVERNKLYTVDNYNLYRTVVIYFDDYLNGGTFTLNHFDEDLVISHGGFINTDEIKIKDRGLIKNTKTELRGDLFLKIKFK